MQYGYGFGFGADKVWGSLGTAAGPRLWKVEMRSGWVYPIPSRPDDANASTFRTKQCIAKPLKVGGKATNNLVVAAESRTHDVRERMREQPMQRKMREASEMQRERRDGCVGERD